jgi:cell division septum initiation protein DivIVA
MSSSALPVDQPLDDQPRGVAGITPPKFATAWRGYDPAGVDAHVRELAEKVEQLQRSEARWRERAEQAERQAELLESPDEHRLIELLGEETARVLDAARQAASDIRRKAEEAAARLISEANDQAHQRRAEGEAEALEARKRLLAEAEDMRQAAADELEKRRAEAGELVSQMHREAQAACDSLRQQGEQDLENAMTEADALRSAAREDARRLVAEAQTLRERTLRDLVRRRRLAREQLERLNAARERLLAAYEVVRRTVDEATTELRVALPEAKAAGDTAMRRAREEPEPTVEELEAQVTMAKMVGLLGEADHSVPAVDRDDVVPSGPGDGVAAPEDLAPGTDLEPHDRQPGHPTGNGAELGYPKHAVEVLPDAAEAGSSGDGRPEASSFEDHVTKDHVSGDDLSRDDLRVDDADTSNGAATSVEPESDASDERAALEPAIAAEAAEEDIPDEPADDEPEHDDSTAPGPTAGEEAPDLAATEPQPDTNGGAPRRQTPQDDELHDLFARLKANRTQSADATIAGDSASAPESSAPELDDDGTEVAEVVPIGAHAEAVDHPQDRRGASEDVAPLGTSPEDERLMRQRDETVESLERALARRLKRVLADEQNGVLDLVRRRRSPTLDELLTHAEAHADRYADAAVDELQAAAFWGAAAVGGQPGESSDALADDLGRAMTEPLRERVSRSLDETDGDLDELTERLRALYREWKGQRVGETVRHYVAAAYARGVFDAVPDDALVRWVVDRSAPVCPDADDNALAGPLPKGEPFPTGHSCPPAHPGCRCVVVPVSIATGGNRGSRSASVGADR